MVPLNYQDTTKWNKFETKYINGVFVSALILDSVNWLSQDEGSENQWRDQDDLQFFEYRLDIPFFKNSVMSIGKQKEPISMNRLTGGTF